MYQFPPPKGHQIGRPPPNDDTFYSPNELINNSPYGYPHPPPISKPPQVMQKISSTDSINNRHPSINGHFSSSTNPMDPYTRRGPTTPIQIPYYQEYNTHATDSNNTEIHQHPLRQATGTPAIRTRTLKNPFDNSSPIENGHQESPSTNSVSTTVTNAMANMMMASVRERMTSNPHMPDLYHFLPSAKLALKQYFNVSHGYVFYKLSIILFPFLHFFRRPNSQQEQQLHRSDQTSSSTSNDTPNARVLHNADLYIPLMALITYVLLFGLTKGTLNEFSPELLAHTATYAITLLILEMLIAKAAFHLTNYGGSMTMLDLLAFGGYKYVHLVLIVCCHLLIRMNSNNYISAVQNSTRSEGATPSGISTIVYWGVFSYFSLCAIIEMLVALTKPVKMETATNMELMYKPVNTSYVAIALAVAQLPLCWLLIPPLQSP